MTEARYWTLDYEMRLQSDFHVGAGATLFGGNVHGLRLDVNGFPSVGDTEIRGLLRQGGWKLQQWRHGLKDLFLRNFGENVRNRQRQVFWSFSSARFDPMLYDNAVTAGILGKQSHARIGSTGTAENLFANQKAGPSADGQFAGLQGRIYSVTPAEARDIAFMIACMRVEDRFGHRRSRGYGKMCWRPLKVRSFLPGKTQDEDNRELKGWLDLALPPEENK